jgi:transposase
MNSHSDCQRSIYSSEGRPSIPPEQLLSALLLQVFYGIRSERQLMEYKSRSRKLLSRMNHL